MSHQDVEDEFGLMVKNRIRKTTTSFRYYDMISNMLLRAAVQKRDFREDILRLVGIYWIHGSNSTVRILKDWNGSLELKQRLIEMINVYSIVDAALYHQPVPTLSRIAEAFPQISLVMAGEINANPSMGLKFWVTDRDLDSRVHYFFKLSCFPSLIHLDSSIKAQACLLLFNLCQTQAALNMHTTSKDITSAFVHSCRFSMDIMEQRLASFESRRKFTKYIEDIAPSAELMYRVWNKVIGETKLELLRATAVTSLHEKVLRAQPLYLVTWKKLLSEKKK